MSMLKKISGGIRNTITKEINAAKERDKVYKTAYVEAEKEALQKKARIDAMRNVGVLPQAKTKASKKKKKTSKRTAKL